MAENSKKPIIVIVDDEPMLLRAYARRLNAEYETHIFMNPLDAQEFVDSTKADLIISDDRMPGKWGTEWIPEIRAGDGANKDTNIVLSSGTASNKEALEAGANDFMPKPVSLDEFKNIIEKWAGQSAETSQSPRSPMDYVTRDDDNDKTPSR